MAELAHGVDRRAEEGFQAALVPFGRDAVVDAPRRTRLLMLDAILAVRVVQLAPWPIAVALGLPHGLSRPWLAATSYAVQAGWSLFFVARARARGKLDPAGSYIDVAVAVACLMAAGWACRPGMATTWANSAVAPAMGAAIAAGVAWPPRRAIAAGLLVAGGYVAGIAPGLGQAGHAAAVGNVVSLTGFAYVGALVARHLVRQADTVSAATEAMLVEREHAAVERQRVAVERARLDERARQYRFLHDTVLSTLNAIARGVNTDDPFVRQRCAAEADLIRGLISGDSRPPSSLAAALAIVGHDQAGLGLRVHTHSADLPEDLPPAVIAALAGATREALNNVAKHAGTLEAWVTAYGEPDTSVVVTIVDQGQGFDPNTVSRGVGLTQSIADRMAEIGAAHLIDSQLDEGCTVELRWPQ